MYNLNDIRRLAGLPLMESVDTVSEDQQAYVWYDLASWPDDLDLFGRLDDVLGDDYRDESYSPDKRDRNRRETQVGVPITNKRAIAFIVNNGGQLVEDQQAYVWYDLASWPDDEDLFGRLDDVLGDDYRNESNSPDKRDRNRRETQVGVPITNKRAIAFIDNNGGQLVDESVSEVEEAYDDPVYNPMPANDELDLDDFSDKRSRKKKSNFPARHGDNPLAYGDNQDGIFEALMAEFEEFQEDSEMDLPLDNSGDIVGWIAMFNGKKLEIKKGVDANDMWSAKQFAAKQLRVPKSRMGLLAIAPAVAD